MRNKLIVFTKISNFAKGIAGGHVPVTREKLIPPFPFDKDKIIKRISEMTKKKTVYEVVRDFRNIHGDKYDYSFARIMEYIS